MTNRVQNPRKSRFATEPAVVIVRTMLLIALCLTAVVQAQPLPGQIIVNPDDPAWLSYHDGGSFFMCGPGDPEGFLYRGTRNPDGTRDGDQMALIDKLKGTGANSIYLMAVRSHGGDGDRTQNPFVQNNPALGLNHAVLDQWETWFAEMDAHGIVIYFFFYDDSANIWSGDAVGSQERSFLETLVQRFRHHKHLIWAVAEEYSEDYSDERVSNIAAVIRAADTHVHPVAVHKRHGTNFSEFADDPNIDQFAIQYNRSSIGALHTGMLTAWKNAAGRYNLNLAEASKWGTGVTARQKSWAVAMGGASVMAYEWDIASTPVSDLANCGRLVRFMEAVDLTGMAPHDELRHGGTQYVLAKPGERYIAYASALSGQIGLKGLAAGTYDVTWYDIAAEGRVLESSAALPAGDQTWQTPAGVGHELAVVLVRTGE
jgi:hypothetical protein